MSLIEGIVETIIRHYPDTQAVYLFGSYGTENEWPNSDADIAILLPPETSKPAGHLMMSQLHGDMELLLERDVDLLNLRLVSTVFQKEIIMAERRIYTGDEYAADEFEMLTLSYYQKLNEERAEVLAEGLRTGRFYNI